MKFYQKKPVIVEAVQWTGNNITEIKEFCPVAIFDHLYLESNPAKHKTNVIIPSLMGNNHVPPGSFIIKDTDGEFFPCREDTFHALYEEVTLNEHTL